jgi:hypothetical protein
MLKPIFAANWKMNHGPSDARAFMRTFLAHLPRGDDRTIAFFPPAITLRSVLDALADRPEILVGVQNVTTSPPAPSPARSRRHGARRRRPLVSSATPSAGRCSARPTPTRRASASWSCGPADPDAVRR